MMTAWEKCIHATRRFAQRADKWEGETKWLWGVNFLAPLMYSYGVIWLANRINANALHISGSDAAYSFFAALPYVGFWGILLANLVAAQRFAKHRFLFCIFILLNGFAFFFLSSIAFATGLFNLSAWLHLPETLSAYASMLSGG